MVLSFPDGKGEHQSPEAGEAVFPARVKRGRRMATPDRTRALKRLQSSCMPGSLRFRIPAIEDRDRQPRLAQSGEPQCQLPFSISELTRLPVACATCPLARDSRALNGRNAEPVRLGIRETAHERRSRSICRHERLRENDPSMSRRFEAFNLPPAPTSAIDCDWPLIRNALRAALLHARAHGRASAGGAAGRCAGRHSIPDSAVESARRHSIPPHAGARSASRVMTLIAASAAR